MSTLSRVYCKPCTYISCTDICQMESSFYYRKPKNLEHQYNCLWPSHQPSLPNPPRPRNGSHWVNLLSQHQLLRGPPVMTFCNFMQHFLFQFNSQVLQLSHKVLPSLLVRHFQLHRALDRPLPRLALGMALLPQVSLFGEYALFWFWITHKDSIC